MHMTLSLRSNETIATLLLQARLAEAAVQATDQVKANPRDTTARILLADLLCLQGAFERADAQLQIASHHAPDDAIGIAQLCGLIRAEVARRAWFEDGALPSFLGQPTPRQQTALQMALALRAADATATACLREELERTHVARRGSCNGVSFDDFRDADDLVQDNIEAVCANGKYYWLTPDALVSLTFAAPRYPRDLMWRRTRAVLHSGEEVELRLPAQYFDEAAADEHRVAQQTDWIASIGGLVLGRGQRTLMIGGEPQGMMDIKYLRFEAPPRES
jgi:type VI secretion system protein ImpE